MLSVRELQAGYGHSQVLFDISFDVKQGECVTLMGRNGMGKTTTIKAIMGLIGTRGGEISISNQSVVGRSPEKVARLGVGLVPEGRQIFSTLTVRENLIATAANRTKRADGWTLDRIYGLFPRMLERQGQPAGTLSGGEQQMLAIGRALMTNPWLLILDEATEGLAPVVRAEIWAVISKLRSEGQAILVVDKNLAALKQLADRHYVFEKGRTVWSGTGADLDRDYERVQGYVGV
jgi:branched-chain amino acid transport system ATP-binding protein